MRSDWIEEKWVSILCNANSVGKGADTKSECLRSLAGGKMVKMGAETVPALSAVPRRWESLLLANGASQVRKRRSYHSDRTGEKIEGRTATGVAVDILSAQPPRTLMEIYHRVRITYLFCPGPDMSSDINGVHFRPFHSPSSAGETDLSWPGSGTPGNLALGTRDA